MDIHDAYQKQGYGRKLVRYFMEHIKEMKMMAVELTAAEDAYQFWEKMGFTHVRTNHQLVYNYVMRLNL
jgi:N-acetylglutamate synthase-like GNAT family acetyltransferase